MIPLPAPRKGNSPDKKKSESSVEEPPYFPVDG